MRGLALRGLRHRTGSYVAAFLAVFFAAAVLMACGGLIETGVRTAVPPDRLAGADVVVAGDQEYAAPGGDPDEPAVLPERVRVDAALVEDLDAVEGVAATSTHVLEGEPPAGLVDAVGVTVEPGADVEEVRDRIDAALTEDGARATTLVGDERGRAEVREALESSRNVVALAGVFTAFALLVSVFGVSSMLGLSVAQRARELALLRAVGATPRQVRRLVLRETALLALVATALAIVPGRLLGELLLDQLARRDIASADLAFHQGWIPTVAASALALLAALAGATGAGRRAARTRPTQALAEAATGEGRLIGPVRAVLALVLLGGGAVLMFVTIAVMSGPLAPATAAPAVLVLAVGVALLSPLWSRLATLVMHAPVAALGGVTGHLAVLNARTSRTAAVTAPVVLLCAVATGMLYLQTTNDRADREAYADNLVADAVLTTSDPAGLDPALLDRAEQLPGVTATSALVTSTGFVETPDDRSPAGEGWTLVGVTAAAAAEVTPVEPVAGSLADLTGDTVALEDEHAARLGLGVGDPLTLRTGDGTLLELTVAATFAAPDDYDTLLLPADTLAARTTAGVATQAVVRADGSVDDLQDLVAGTPVTVADREVLLAAYDDARRTSTFAIWTMVLMIAGYAAVTVVNLLASSTVARRKELGLQRLAGSTRAQVLRMVATEAGLVAVGGLALGTLAAAAVVVPVSLKRLDTVVPAGGPWAYAGVVLGTVLLVLAATLLPAWRATRGRPAEAVLAVD